MRDDDLARYPRGILDPRWMLDHGPRVPSAGAADLAELIRRAYPDPSMYDSAESFARANHDDISGLDDEALDRERIKATLRWAFAPSPWADSRRDRLDREAARRLRLQQSAGRQ